MKTISYFLHIRNKSKKSYDYLKRNKNPLNYRESGFSTDSLYLPLSFNDFKKEGVFHGQKTLYLMLEAHREEFYGKKRAINVSKRRDKAQLRSTFLSDFWWFLSEKTFNFASRCMSGCYCKECLIRAKKIKTFQKTV